MGDGRGGGGGRRSRSTAVGWRAGEQLGPEVAAVLRAVCKASEPGSAIASSNPHVPEVSAGFFPHHVVRGRPAVVRSERPSVSVRRLEAQHSRPRFLASGRGTLGLPREDNYLW